jgi:integrase
VGVTEGQVERVGEAPEPAVAVLEDTSASVVLATLAEEGRRLDENARARRTWASYQRDWTHFTDWCTSVDLDPLPAAPSTVALYLTEMARSFKVSTLRRRLAAISVVHQGYGHPSPTADVTVRTRMKGIARDKADEQVTRKAPAWGRDVRRMVADLDDDPRGARDRALLTIGFAGGFRRSELVGLDVTDVTETNDGLVVHIRRSKTDQEGTGRTIGIPYGSHPTSCPVRAFRAWRALNNGPSGPMFRRIRGHATLGARLTDRSVALIVKDAATRIGLNPADFAGHSLRAGFVTSAADGGASEAAIMEQTGHRSTKQLRDYMRDGRLFHNNAAAVTGL